MTKRLFLSLAALLLLVLAISTPENVNAAPSPAGGTLSILEKLRALGMQEIKQPRAKLVAGKIRIDQLLKLAELKEVQFATLQQ
jgi:hypothetical protein